MVQLNFDASQVSPDMGREALPAGWYNAVMDESEMKATRDGLGAYLNCRFNVVDGQFAGRKVYALLNLKNANAQAMEIAFKELSAIAHAVGVLHIADSSQLHNRPLKIKVKVDKDKSGEYEDSNRITMYKNINEVVDQPKGAAAPAASGFVPPPDGAPPISFPPAGWTAHPSAPGFYYAGQEVISEADLKARFAAPPAPPAPPTDAPAVWSGGAQQPWAGGAPAEPPGSAAPPAAGPAGQPGTSAPPAAPPAASATAPSAAPPWAQPQA
jgi:hypothetical protein